MKKIVFSLLIITLFTSCAQMFNGAVLPNQCKKCDLVNRMNNEILWSIEGCGSDNTRLEEQTQIKAYEMSRGGYNLCDLEVVCESWKKDPETEA